MPILWDGSAPAPSVPLCGITATIQACSDIAKKTAPPIFEVTDFNSQEKNLLYWALIFLWWCESHGILGFTGVAIAAAGIANCCSFFSCAVPDFFGGSSGKARPEILELNELPGPD